ncbi:TonB-dependent receptor plug domain-containing protein [Aurantivibrio infirmus]
MKLLRIIAQTAALSGLVITAPSLVCAEDELFEPVDGKTSPTDESALDSTITYPASFFDQYEPVSARDMLNRIPGIDSILGGGRGGNDRRGLGAGGDNILIDGKRIAGKENSGRETLARIAASQVDYFEIIRGTSSELEVRSAGPIVNVVMKEGAGRSSISAEINADYHSIDGYVQPGGKISFGGQSGRFNYLASLDIEPRYQAEIRNEESLIADANGFIVPNDTREEIRTHDETEYKLSTNIGYEFSPKSTIQLNALYQVNDRPRENEITIFDLTTPTPATTSELEDRESERNKWEIGGNYSYKLDNGGKYNLIFVINDSTDNNTEDRFDVLTTGNSKYLFIETFNRSRERIFRTSYSQGLSENQDVEVGIERAETILDSSLKLGLENLGTIPSTAFGGFNIWRLDNNSIDEVRYEPFITHNWQLASNMALESTLVVEYSEVTQQGNPPQYASGVLAIETEGVNKKFDFIKPKFDYRYDISPSLQFRATLERDISQLNLRDFVPESSGDPNRNITEGNFNLEQEKTWKYEFNLEYRLADDAGVLNSRIFYHDIDDVIDLVDVTPAPSVADPTPLLTSAKGNIGKGKRYGLELNSSIRLGFLGVPDALVTAGAFVQDSEVTDPFLGIDRRLEGEGRGNVSMGFRHDVTRWNLSYGGNYRYLIRGNNTTIDIDQIRQRERDPFSSLFIEKVAFGGITFRLETMNFLNGERCLKRTRFVGATADGVFEEVESSCIGDGRKIALKIRSNF